MGSLKSRETPGIGDLGFAPGVISYTRDQSSGETRKQMKSGQFLHEKPERVTFARLSSRLLALEDANMAMARPNKSVRAIAAVMSFKFKFHLGDKHRTGTYYM